MTFNLFLFLTSAGREICLTLEVLLDPLVLRLSPLLEFLLKINQELRGDTLDRSEDSGSWRTQTTTMQVHIFMLIHIPAASDWLSGVSQQSSGDISQQVTIATWTNLIRHGGGFVPLVLEQETMALVVFLCQDTSGVTFSFYSVAFPPSCLFHSL